MKKNFILYVAVKGTYDADLTSLYLTPMQLEEKTFKKDLKAIKKQLKLSNVVVEANEYVLKNIKIEFVYVTPKISLENMSTYRGKVKDDSFLFYYYPMLLVKLNKIAPQLNRIELIYDSMLEDLIERSE